MKLPSTFLAAIAVLSVAIGGCSAGGRHLADAGDAGTPITKENLVDVLEIQRVTGALTNAVDTRQWDVARDILQDKVDTTIGERERGASSVKSADEIVARWEGFYDSAETLVIHHLTANERILFDDRNNATAFSKGVIVVENTPAGEFSESGGKLRLHRWVNYEIGVTRTDGGWKVNKVLVDYLVEEISSLPRDAK